MLDSLLCNCLLEREGYDMTWNNNRYLEECLVIVSCLLLNNCASPDARTPYKQYALVPKSSAPISTNDKEALKKAIVIHLLPSKTIKTAITTEDPIIVTNDVYSNYKIFEIKGDMNMDSIVFLITFKLKFGIWQVGGTIRKRRFILGFPYYETS